MARLDRAEIRERCAIAWTPRQREVLDLLARRRTNGEIAEALGITLYGAKWHVSEIISILGVDTREEAAEYWRQYNGFPARLRRIVVPVFAIPVLKWTAAGAAVAVVAAGAVIALSLGDNDGGVQAGSFTGTAPPSVAAEVTPAPTVTPPVVVPPFGVPAAFGLPACSPTGLRVLASKPNGATAMMGLSIIIANVSDSACALPRPTRVRMVDDTGTLREVSRDGPNAIIPTVLDLPPTRAPVADESTPPAGAANVWLIWTWQGAITACAQLDPPNATVVLEFADGTEVAARATVKLAPCGGTLRLAGFTHFD